MSTVNIPLLRKMVEWVEEQETLTENREWYQREWITATASRAPVVGAGFCDTAYCVAGKVAVDAGWRPEPSGFQVSKDGVVARVDTVARRELGITIEEGAALFSGNNTAAGIRRIAEDLAGERL